MSKELEALHKIANIEMKEQYSFQTGQFVYRVVSDDYSKELKIIEKALKKLETLEEENKLLRENIESLDETYFETWRACQRLKENSNYALMFIDDIYCLVDTKDNKFEVIDNHEINIKGIIENKKLKALEIIKEKKPSVQVIWHCKDYNVYQEYLEIVPIPEEKQLTKEEYDLLKEVLL